MLIACICTQLSNAEADVQAAREELQHSGDRSHQGTTADRTSPSALELESTIQQMEALKADNERLRRQLAGAQHAAEQLSANTQPGVRIERSKTCIVLHLHVQLFDACMSHTSSVVSYRSRFWASPAASSLEA